MEKSKIDSEKIRAAREKLACHIEPPKGSPYAEALAKSGAASPQSDTAGINESSDDTDRSGASASADSCGASACDAGNTGGRIRLTEMTSAGG